MSALNVELFADGVPEGAAPEDQLWGYAGHRRPDVSDDTRPDFPGAWAGHVDPWSRAVEASASWQALLALGGTRFIAWAGDV
ncbi:MAG TPA: hypothetical protein VN238_21770 [Solirubrobacteraceae bacterium]|nr:hypothetical protein [Solirubrobacteraceae bacterium]